MVRSQHYFLPTVLLLALTACSAGTGGNGALGGASQPGFQPAFRPNFSAPVGSIGVINAFGSHAKSVLVGSNIEISSSFGIRAHDEPRGRCWRGVEFFAPDRHGDANSNEILYFYNPACTQLAVDTVNVITPYSTSTAKVATTTKTYQIGKTTVAATMVATTQIANATFDSGGFPILADGFSRTTVSQLSLGSTLSIDNDDEMVLEPSSGATATVCDDFAGFDVAGIPSLDATFGWQGGALVTGTTTENANGTSTWRATVAGSIPTGPIGSLSIAQGTANTSCPIATPQFTISGGSSIGSFSVPISLTTYGSLVTFASVTGAQLPGGLTLSVATHTSQAHASTGFITGQVRGAGAKLVATFGLNAFGNGYLAIPGVTTLPIVDFTVVQ